MSNNNQNNYYSNPAFCQQSEYYGAKSPTKIQRAQSVRRQSPVGAQSIISVHDPIVRREISLPPTPGPKPIHYQRIHKTEEPYEEQEFYEEMVVDESGNVQEKKFVVVHNETRSGARYSRIPQNNKETIGARYEVVPSVEIPKHRYECIPMLDAQIGSQNRNQNVQYHTEIEASTGRIHRYAVIPSDDEEPTIQTTRGRYALVPVEDVINKNRYAVITEEDIQNSNRYESIPSPPPETISPPAKRRPPNPDATRKLHELLATPRKVTKSLPPTPIRNEPKQSIPSLSPIHASSFHSTRKQQKLNYALGSRQTSPDKRHVAVVAPICSSPIESVYSETTVPNKTKSWMNLSMKKQPVQASLKVAAVLMILCGSVSSGLSFYMISFMDRLYFLDFGIVSGFTCLLLGCLGLRSRNVYWLPNRNYISGYLILSLFSLLTCIALLVLLVLRPRQGTPLADMTSGAVCGISAISLLLASSGIVASYCCKVPPPDNRVQHCAQGFTV